MPTVAEHTSLRRLASELVLDISGRRKPGSLFSFHLPLSSFAPVSPLIHQSATALTSPINPLQDQSSRSDDRPPPAAVTYEANPRLRPSYLPGDCLGLPSTVPASPYAVFLRGISLRHRRQCSPQEALAFISIPKTACIHPPPGASASATVNKFVLHLLFPPPNLEVDNYPETSDSNPLHTTSSLCLCADGQIGNRLEPSNCLS